MKRIIRFISIIMIIAVLAITYSVVTFDPSNSSYTLGPELYAQVEDREEYARLNEVSGEFIQMLVMMEDQRFNSHFGFDPIAIAQAMVRNIKAGELEAGGSTITQQLAKNLFYTQDQNIKRKVYELWTAIRLEQMFTKDQIIEMYINVIYYGSDAYGISQACRTYFDITPAELTREQAAILVGLLPAPSVYNPIDGPEISSQRKELVLDLFEIEINEK
ncbi:MULTISPECIES: biosynthetic peptidoglycan transglycosylase [unclassified Fusibacter]|uniref:biosynthetic peptidoglycan transglycosylase n=1 Tax=unclassified Fusibacter TaxID=2624464 RepID=UPI0010127578|nr:MULTISPECIES: biosynthetic peptidoglycan transglycosylase [unclassified Fusibacter]MCK8061220.1 transglycosylase domain-containing protein [Fusibacter sp. A2]NPE23436.1 transglycosylase domain-containing protein [Fusibacter sp. A1]RXV59215.1 glycosyl transferase [Fusibacter sp. A1]